MPVLIIAAALVTGWLACRIGCSPSCRRGAYLWTPELERAAFDRGRGVGVAEGRGELTAAQLDGLARLLDEQIPTS